MIDAGTRGWLTKWMTYLIGLILSIITLALVAATLDGGPSEARVLEAAGQ